MNKFLLYCLLSALVLFSACSTDENLPSNPNVPGKTVTDERRLVILEECRVKLEELHSARAIEDKIQLIAWLMQKPDFQSAGFMPESNAVYAVFTDERIVLFVDTPKTDDLPGGGRKRPEAGSGSRLKGTAGTQELPKSVKVSLFNGMGTYFGDNTVAIEKIFAASKTAYTVNRKPASIENLKQVSGDGVFYMFTHGGGGAIPNPPPRKDSTFVMSLWTTAAVTTANEQVYKQDLQDKKLAYMFSTYDTDKPVSHYGITGEFIKSYMSFAENCLIYIDACNSNRTIPTGVAFRNLVMDKAVNKKATYIGWTFETNEFMATRASQFIFDRLLGTNTTGSGSTPIPKEDPIQRPFDLEKIFSDLQGRRFDVCANAATLWYDSRVDEDILLTPTIETMEVDEYTSTLSIYGSFGSEQGKVTVDGQGTAITQWSPGIILCAIPETGAGSAGDVIVSVRENKSNPVPITQWKVRLNYATDDNGVRLEGAVNLIIRADIHPRRTKPKEAPSVPEPVDYGPSSGFLFGNSSNATYAIGGQKYARCNTDPCVSYYQESPLVKTGSVPYLKLGATQPSMIGFYNWTPDRKTIKIDFLTVSLPGVTTTHYEIRYQCPASDETTKYDVATTMGFSVPADESLDVIKLEIADNYNIRSGSFSKSVSRPWNPCDLSGTYSVLVTWELVRPDFAPTDMTAARTRAGDNE